MPKTLSTISKTLSSMSKTLCHIFNFGWNLNWHLWINNTIIWMKINWLTFKKSWRMHIDWWQGSHCQVFVKLLFNTTYLASHQFRYFLRNDSWFFVFQNLLLASLSDFANDHQSLLTQHINFSLLFPLLSCFAVHCTAVSAFIPLLPSILLLHIPLLPPLLPPSLI